jgi:hypothetical protein
VLLRPPCQYWQLVVVANRHPFRHVWPRLRAI